MTVYIFLICKWPCDPGTAMAGEPSLSNFFGEPGFTHCVKQDRIAIEQAEFDAKPLRILSGKVATNLAKEFRARLYAREQQRANKSTAGIFLDTKQSSVPRRR